VSALQESRRAARSAPVGWLGRAGLAAQGICFGIIGVLAIALALGEGGRATDPQGALNTLARHGWTKALLVLLCFGFAGYAIWRLAQALFDRGGMGSDLGGLFRRAIQLVQGLAYVALTIGAIKTIAGAGGRAGDEQRAAGGVLGWPGGRELVGLVAVVLMISAVVTAYWGWSRRFEESLATDEMGSRTRKVVVASGVVGLTALAVVLGIVGWFLLDAAVTFDPRAPVGIGGALSKLAHASYGGWLLALTAAGLIVFALFDLLQFRYHEA
jgi:hypothetical protein